MPSPADQEQLRRLQEFWAQQDPSHVQLLDSLVEKYPLSERGDKIHDVSLGRNQMIQDLIRNGASPSSAESLAQQVSSRAIFRHLEWTYQFAAENPEVAGALMPDQYGLPTVTPEAQEAGFPNLTALMRYAVIQRQAREDAAQRGVVGEIGVGAMGFMRGWTSVADGILKAAATVGSLGMVDTSGSIVGAWGETLGVPDAQMRLDAMVENSPLGVFGNTLGRLIPTIMMAQAMLPASVAGALPQGGVTGFTLGQHGILTGGLTFGAAEFLATPGSLSERGGSAFSGGVAGVLGGSVNAAIGRFFSPYIIPRLVTMMGADRATSQVVANAVFPHLIGTAANSLAFSLFDKLQGYTIAGKDIPLMDGFLHNLLVFGTLSAIHGAKRTPAFGRLARGKSTLAQEFPGIAGQVEAALFGGKQIVAGAIHEMAISGEKNVELLGSYIGQAVKDTKSLLRQQGLPPVLVATAARLAQRGHVLDPAFAKELLGSVHKMMDVAAARFGLLVGNDASLVAKLDKLGAERSIEVDPLFGDPRTQQALYGETVPMDLATLLELPQLKGHARAQRLLQRHQQLHAERDAEAAKIDLKYGERIELLLNPMFQVNDVGNPLLADYVRALEKQGTISPEPGLFRREGTPEGVERFMAQLPEAPVEFIRFHEMVRPNAGSLSEALAGLRIVAQSGEVPEGVPGAPVIRHWVSRTMMGPQQAQRTLEAIQSHAQKSLDARGLPDQFIVFRSGDLDPNHPTAVSLDPRVALAHDPAVGVWKLKGYGLKFQEGLELPSSETPRKPFRAYLVNKADVLADLDGLQRGRERDIIGELHVDPMKLTPVDEIPFPLPKDIRAILKTMPDTWAPIQRVGRLTQMLNTVQMKLQEASMPVASVAGQPVLRLEFETNPYPYSQDNLLKIRVRDVSEGMAVVRGVSERMGKIPEVLRTGGDALEALREVLGSVYAPEVEAFAGKKSAVYQKTVQWARDLVTWHQQPADTRGEIPRPPPGVRNPLGIYGLLESAFGNELSSIVQTGAGLLGPRSVGRAAMHKMNPDDVARYVRKAWEDHVAIPPQLAATMATHARRSDVFVRDLPTPAERLKLVETLDIPSKVAELLDTMNKTVRDSSGMLFTESAEGEVGAAIRTVFPLKPGLVRGQLFQSAQTLIWSLVQRAGEGKNAKYRMSLGIDLSNLVMDGVLKYMWVAGTSMRNIRMHLRELTKYHDSLDAKGQALEDPFFGLSERQASWRRIFAFGEGKGAVLGEQGLHPAEVNFLHALKTLYQNFEDGLLMLGVKPRRSIGAYMTRISEDLMTLAGSDLPQKEAAQLRDVTSRFLRERKIEDADLNSLVLNFHQILDVYIPSVSRVLAYRPFTMAVRHILEQHGYSGGDGRAQARHLGFNLPVSIPHNPKSGLPFRTVEYLIKMTDRLAGKPGPLSRRLEHYTGLVGEGIAKILKPFGLNWMDSTQRKGRKILGTGRSYIHTAALSGPRFGMMFRNILTGGVITFFDKGLGPKALLKGMGSFLTVNPKTGVVRVNPIVAEILGDDRTTSQINALVSEAYTSLQARPLAGKAREVFDFMMLPFAASEIGIRGSVALGAYQLAIEAGSSKPQAFKFARHAAMRTQTNYGAEEGAPAASGSMGKVFGQLQRFSWNYTDLMLQHADATGIFGQDRAAGARALQADPVLHREGVLPATKIPSLDGAAALRTSVMAGTRLATLGAMYAAVNAGLRHLFGIHVQDQEGILAPSPSLLKATVNMVVQRAVEELGPGKVPDKQKIARTIAYYLGVDAPPADTARLVDESVGPMVQMTNSALNLALYWGDLSPRQRAEMLQGFDLITPLFAQQFDKAMEASREGFVRSRSGARVGPRGRVLTTQETMRMALGFRPTSIEDAMQSYSEAAAIENWYDSRVAQIGEAALEALRRGEPRHQVFADWINAHAAMEEELGSWNSMYELRQMWRRLLAGEQERSDETLRERLEKQKPLKRIR